MKKFLIALLVIVLGVLGGVGMYALTIYMNEEEEANAQELKNGKKTIENKPILIRGDNNMGSRNVSRYIFVGDSRYVGMEHLATDQDVFICEVGEGYNFLLNHLDEIKSNIIDENTVIIIGLGVNDYKYNLDNYIQTINQLASEVQCSVCYMLVNPVDEDIIQYNGYNITNDELDEFNNNMKQALNPAIQIIDTNSYLKNYGYTTQDGLHYDEETYYNIYEYIKVCVTNN